MSQVVATYRNHIASEGEVSPVFSDGFESGVWSTGEVGGNWYSRNSASLVYVDATNPRTDSYALRFKLSSVPLGTDCSAEARFNLTTPVSELWWEYYTYIPSNYDHRVDPPSNNKWWIIGYDDNLHAGWDEEGGWTLRMEINPASSPNISQTRLVYGFEGSGASSENANGYGPYLNQYTAYITESDLGTWVRWGIYFKLATSQVASDGVCLLYKNGSLILTNSGYPFSGIDYANPADSFEVVGWANSGFTDETIIDIDDMAIYTSNPGWGG